MPKQTGTAGGLDRPGNKVPTVPGYELGRQLGTGNYGTVWEARSERLSSKRAAVKIMHDTVPAKVALDEAKKQHEVKHVNIVDVENVVRARVERKHRDAIILEYCDGSLSKWFEENRSSIRKGVPYKTAKPFLEGILSGMIFAHDKGMIHG